MSTLTIPAPKIEIGDRIDGRTVRVVTGRQKRSCTEHGGPLELDPHLLIRRRR